MGRFFFYANVIMPISSWEPNATSSTHQEGRGWVEVPTLGTISATKFPESLGGPVYGQRLQLLQNPNSISNVDHVGALPPNYGCYSDSTLDANADYYPDPILFAHPEHLDTYQSSMQYSVYKDFPVESHHNGTATIGVAQAEAVSPAQPRRTKCTFTSCKKDFANPGDMRRHLKTHSHPEFRCIIGSCPFTSTRLDKVKDHLKVHSKRFAKFSDTAFAFEQA